MKKAILSLFLISRRLTFITGNIQDYYSTVSTPVQVYMTYFEIALRKILAKSIYEKNLRQSHITEIKERLTIICKMTLGFK
jgi:hypothetical protein